MAQAIRKLEVDMTILHVENNESVLKNFGALFKAKGYTVLSALSPVSAVKYFSTPKKINLAIMDILFEDAIPNSVSGDEFIRKSKEFLGDARIFAHTGHADEIKSENLPLFDEIIVKGHDEDLLNEVDNVFQLEVDAFIERAKNPESENTNQYILAHEDIKRHQERLISQLKSAKDINAPIAVFEDKEYSAGDVIKEIENNTEIGRLHINMMLDYLDDKGRKK